MNPISPSQLKDYAPEFGGCPRKWAAKRSGYTEPPGKAAQWGTAFHRVPQAVVRDGAEIPYDEYGLLFQECLPYLPSDWATAGEAEGRMRTSLEGIDFWGDVDLTIVPAFGERALVIDWKTSSDPVRYGLTPETLPGDPQGILYPEFVFANYPYIHEVEARWQYFDTRKKTACEPVTIWVDRPTSADRMREKILPPARQMVQLSSELPQYRTLDVINAVEHNPAACKSIGHWCPFANHCKMHKGPLTMSHPQNVQNALAALQQPSQAPAAAQQVDQRVAQAGLGGGLAAVNPPEQAQTMSGVAAEINQPPPPPPTYEYPAAAQPPPPVQQELPAPAPAPLAAPTPAPVSLAAPTPAPAPAPAPAPLAAPAPAPQLALNAPEQPPSVSVDRKFSAMTAGTLKSLEKFKRENNLTTLEIRFTI